MTITATPATTPHLWATSRSRNRNAIARAVASVAATVIGAAGSFTLAAPAQAYPPQGSHCTQFGFKGPQPFQANGHPRASNDGTWRVQFGSVGTTASGPATVFFFNTGETITGHIVSGGIEGRSINFRIQWDDKPNNFWDFSGTVNDHGVARGTETLVGGDMPASWMAGFALDCLALGGEPTSDGPILQPH